MNKCLVMPVILVLAIVLIGFNASAADRPLVRKYLEVSGFRDSLKQEFRSQSSSMAGLDIEKFFSHFNFTKAEDLYAEAMISGLSNEEINALIAAYAIPGYKTALRKQTLASGAIMSFVIEEVKRIVPLLGK